MENKNCPVCGCYIKINTGNVHSCSSCPFKCFEEDFDNISNALILKIKLKELLPESEKLELLANWIDSMYPNDKDPEVQTDLRIWTNNIRIIRTYIK